MQRKRKPHFLRRLFALSWVLTSAAWIVRFVISTFYSTFRVRFSGEKEFLQLVNNRNEKPLIIAVWHNRLFLLGPLLRRLVAHDVPLCIMISESRDGILPTAYGETYSQVNVIKVAHASKQQALLESLDALQEGKLLIITPDGPKGPCYSVKPGTIFAANETSASIVPFGWHASKSIRLKSWDRFCIPLPFTTITCTIGKEIHVKGKSIEEATTELTQALLSLYPQNAL